MIDTTYTPVAPARTTAERRYCAIHDRLAAASILPDPTTRMLALGGVVFSCVTWLVLERATLPTDLLLSIEQILATAKSRQQRAEREQAALPVPWKEYQA